MASNVFRSVLSELTPAYYAVRETIIDLIGRSSPPPTSNRLFWLPLWCNCKLLRVVFWFATQIIHAGLESFLPSIKMH